MATPKRNYMVTIPNPTGPFQPELYPLIGYAVWQLEIAPTTGLPHYQCYLELSKPSRFSAIKALSPDLAKAHYEQREGNQAQAIFYCTKTETRAIVPPLADGEMGPFPFYGPWFYGVPAVQGKKRNAEAELLSVADQVFKQHRTAFDIVEKQPLVYHTYGRTIEKMEEAYRLKRYRGCKPHVFVLVGPPNAFKSRTVRDIEPSVWSRPLSDSMWWEGYCGQEAILMDDYRCSDPFNVFLRYIDRFEITVPKRNHKGGEPMMAKRIYITSPDHPDLWWPRIEENRGQLMRRITQIIDTTTRHWESKLYDFSRLPNELNVRRDPAAFPRAPRLDYLELYDQPRFEEDDDGQVPV